MTSTSAPQPSPSGFCGDAPLLSVVVVAHERRAYLPDALRSLELQSLPRDRFQVVLLKDFPAPELRAPLDRLDAQVFDLEPGPLGAWVARVLPQLRGEVVCFLDDDDAFTPEKLAWVTHTFQREPTALYAHHGVEAVSASGVPDQPALPTSSRQALWSPTTVPPAEWKRTFGRIWRGGAAFNLSSIAVRRSVLSAFPSELARVKVSLSAFLFYISLRLEGTLVLDGNPLTLYRRVEGARADGVPLPRSASRLSSLAGPRGEDARLLLELAEGLGLPPAEAPLRAAVAQATLVRALEGGPVPRRGAITSLATLVRDRPWGALLAERAVMRDGVLFALHPAWGRRAWAAEVGALVSAEGVP